MTIPGRYMTQSEAADYLGVSQRTLEKWRHDGKGPGYVKVSRKMIRYVRETLDRFMDSLQVRTLDDGLS